MHPGCGLEELDNLYRYNYITVVISVIEFSVSGMLETRKVLGTAGV